MEHSPVPTKQVHEPKLVQFEFDEAISHIVAGEKVTKLDWDKGWYVFVDSDILKIRKPDGSTHSWIISTGDISGKDYVVYG